MNPELNIVRNVPLQWATDSPDTIFAVENPATGAVVAQVQGSTPEDVDRAVRYAHNIWKSDWRWRPFMERSALLGDCARLLARHAVEIARLEALEMGKPFTQAMGDVAACVNSFKMFSAFSYTLPNHSKDEGPALNISILEPYGVVGGIIPFNWPPIHAAAKIAPALAVGNCIVVKPPEQAPSSILRVVELINTILPEGVVGAVCGFGPIGEALAKHPLIRMVSFTGSPQVGAKVLHSLADKFTPSIMELGGKNPLIIFEDADVDLAIRWVIDGAFFNQGEACTAASRILVHRSHHDYVAGKVAAAVKKLRVGDPMDPKTHIGPLVSPSQQARVMEYLDIGVKEGAVIAAQAPLPTDEKYKNGCWAPPTLFVNVTSDMRIAREEIFGPVTAIIPFDTYEEVIEIANSVEFGLVAGVFSRDFATCWRASREIEAGLVFANNYSRQYHSGGTPFGGIKSSGFGREHTLETIKEFGYTKNMRVLTGIGDVPRWFAVSEVLGG